MSQIIQTIAALVAIIFAPIGCWLAYKSIPKDRLEELKKEFGHAKNLIIFVLVLASLSISLFFEATSSDPLTRLAVAKMCTYAALIVLWLSLQTSILMLKAMQAQSNIIARHLDVTKSITEIFSVDGR